MDDTKTSLLRAIACNTLPADDEIRRSVLADWEDDFGNPEKAELIRLQLNMRRLMHEGGHEEEVLALKRRENELLRKPEIVDLLHQERGTLSDEHSEVSRHGANAQTAWPPTRGVMEGYALYNCQRQTPIIKFAEYVNKLPLCTSGVIIIGDSLRNYRPYTISTSDIQNINNPRLAYLDFNTIALDSSVAMQELADNASLRGLRQLKLGRPCYIEDEKWTFLNRDARAFANSQHLRNLDNLTINGRVSVQAMNTLLQDGSALKNTIICCESLRSRSTQREDGTLQNTITKLREHNQQAAAAQGVDYSVPKWMQQCINASQQQQSGASRS